MIQMLGFDMDGTLFSSDGIIHDAYINAVNGFNKDHYKNAACPEKDAIVYQLGRPVNEIFANLFPGLSFGERRELDDRSMEELIRLIRQEKGEMMEGALTVIPVLAEKYRLVVASNGRLAYLGEILKTYDLLDCFQPILTLDYAELHDKGDLLKRYLDRYNTKPLEAVMVGDRASDLNAARKAGTLFIGCRYGHAGDSEIKNEKYLVDSLMEVPELLESLTLP